MFSSFHFRKVTKWNGFNGVWFHGQWFIETVDLPSSIFYLKSAKGGYIGFDGRPNLHAPIQVSTDKVLWQLRPEPNDPHLIR